MNKIKNEAAKFGATNTIYGGNWNGTTSSASGSDTVDYGSIIDNTYHLEINLSATSVTVVSNTLVAGKAEIKNSTGVIQQTDTLSGIEHIRETAPFPRLLNRLYP